MSGRKYIFSGLLVFTFLFSTLVPSLLVPKAEADTLGNAAGLLSATSLAPKVPTGDSVSDLVMTTLKLAMKAVAQNAIERIVGSTITWINNGFNGGPAYVTDPEGYFSSIANGALGDYINQDGNLHFLCQPFQVQIRASLAINYAPRTPTYSCTLTGVLANLDGFYNSFQGGWDSWFQITQNPSNNPYGAYLSYSAAATQSVANAVGLAQNEYSVNSGFLSWKDCTTTTVDGKPKQTCSVKTPGSVIANQVNAVLPSGFNQLVNAKDFDDLIDAFMGQLLKKTVFGGEGLFSNSASSFAGSAGNGSSNGNGPVSTALSCAPDKTAVTLGDKVTWGVNNTPLAGAVDYNWRSSDGQATSSDETGSFSITYNAAGKQTMFLSATTYDITFDPNTGTEDRSNPKQIAEVPCSGSVLVAQYPPLQLLDCRPSSLQTDYEQPVTWTAIFTGGSGNIKSIQWAGNQPNPPQCQGATCAASIWPPALPPTPSTVTYTYPNNGRTGTTVQSLSVASSTMTSTLERVYYKNNSTNLGDAGANITIIDSDLNVLPIQNASCGTIFVRP